MSLPRVGIVTSLSDFSSAYSLSSVILDQARALHRAGWEYELLCLRNFDHQDQATAEAEGLHMSFRLARTRLHAYSPGEGPLPDRDGAPGFRRQVDIYLDGDDSGEGYRTALEPFDVVITHDLMFLSSYLPQNQAIRRCVDLWPRKRWLHWIHSAPSIVEDAVYPYTLRYQGCLNSTYVLLNSRQRQDLANMLGIDSQQLAVVHNMKDLRDVYEFCPQTCALIDEYRLMEHEILQVYPFSTPRWVPKGVRQLLRIFAAWKEAGIVARLVLVNAHCHGEQSCDHLHQIEDYARYCGLEIGKDVVLTSRFAERNHTDPAYRRWDYSVPQRVVRELTLLANIFILPSVSEGCSLIQAENAIAGKFMVLNRNVPAVLELCGPNVFHYEFTDNHPDTNPHYYECVARELWSHLQADATFLNATLARTKTYNRDWIWRHQLEPLLYRGFDRDREAPQAPRSTDREAPQAPRSTDREAPQAPRLIDQGAKTDKSHHQPPS